MKIQGRISRLEEIPGGYLAAVIIANWQYPEGLTIEQCEEWRNHNEAVKDIKMGKVNLEYVED